jgi:hypothetical protein
MQALFLWLDFRSVRSTGRRYGTAVFKSFLGKIIYSIWTSEHHPDQAQAELRVDS